MSCCVEQDAYCGSDAKRDFDRLGIVDRQLRAGQVEAKERREDASDIS